MAQKKKKGFLDEEMNPFWVWFLMVILNAIIYTIYGFEFGLLVAIWILLWYKMVVEK